MKQDVESISGTGAHRKGFLQCPSCRYDTFLPLVQVFTCGFSCCLSPFSPLALGLNFFLLGAAWVCPRRIALQSAKHLERGHYGQHYTIAINNQMQNKPEENPSTRGNHAKKQKQEGVAMVKTRR